MNGLRKKTLAILAVAMLFLASCGSGSDSSSADGSTDEDTSTEATTEDDAGSDDASDDGDEMADEEDAEAEGDAGDEAAAAAPSGEPVKIAALTSLTGNFTPWGVQVQDGMKLAVEDINAAGGVGGRPLELVVVDDQSNAEEAIAQFQKLAEEGVIGVVGGISSDVGTATSAIAEQNEVPYALIKAASDAVLTRDSRYTFRTCLPAAPMLGDILYQGSENEGVTQAGAIIADYGWGRSLEGTLNGRFEGSDIAIQIEAAPVGETDFTTYLRSLQDAGAQNIIATGHPPGAGAIVTQSKDLGFDVPVFGAAVPFDLIADAAPDAAIDRYTDIKCVDFESDGYKELAPRYLEMSDNKIMSEDAVAAYGITMFMAEAAAESDAPADVAAYLHANSYQQPGMAFTLEWTEWGELATATPTLTRVIAGPPPEGMSNASDAWWVQTVLTVDPLAPYEPS